MDELKPLAVVTGASTGIGYQLALCCVAEGCDLVIVADEAKIAEAASEFRNYDAAVSDVQTDLATRQGLDQLIEAIRAMGKPVELLLAKGYSATTRSMRFRFRATAALLLRGK